MKAKGTLERRDGVTSFTQFDVHAELTTAAGTDAQQAQTPLQRAERGCLVSNSQAEVHLKTEGIQAA